MKKLKQREKVSFNENIKILPCGQSPDLISPDPSYAPYLENEYSPTPPFVISMLE